MSRYRKPGSSTKTDTANVRCAIYSRKSSEEGLDLEFLSKGNKVLVHSDTDSQDSIFLVVVLDDPDFLTDQ